MKKTIIGVSLFVGMVSSLLAFVAPANLTAFVTNTGMSSASVRLNWNDNSSDETGYVVYRAMQVNGSSTEFALFQTLASNSTTTLYSVNRTCVDQKFLYIVLTSGLINGMPFMKSSDVVSATITKKPLCNIVPMSF